MKIFAYISLISAACYFALFVSIPLTGYIIAYFVFIFCLLNVIGGLQILVSSDKDSAKRIVLSSNEMNLITYLKTNKVDLVKVITTGMTISAAATKDGDYTFILIPADNLELIDKVKSVIIESEGA